MTATIDNQSSQSSRPTLSSGLRSVLSLGLAAALIVVVVPRFAGTSWTTIASVLGAVTLAQFLLLGLLWVVGLFAHSTTLTAAMPTLSRRRALLLSLTGSAVSNVLPFGGPAGLALNYRMSRVWGFEPRSIGIYTVVTNIWDILVRLTLPAVAVAWLILSGGYGAGQFIGTASIATAALLGFAGLTITVLISDRIAERAGSLIDRVGAAVSRMFGREAPIEIGSTLKRFRAETTDLIRSAWPRLTFGVVAYSVLLGGLLWACLSVTSAGVAIPAIVAGLALERVMTLVPITPGGVGIVEVGMTSLLIALGGAPAATVTGVILYRFFTYGIEIPVGGAGVLSWLWIERRRDSSPSKAFA